MLVFIPLSSFCLACVYSDVHSNCTFKLIKGKGAWHGLQIALESIGSSPSVTGLQPVFTARHCSSPCRSQDSHGGYSWLVHTAEEYGFKRETQALQTFGEAARRWRKKLSLSLDIKQPLNGSLTLNEETGFGFLSALQQSLGTSSNLTTNTADISVSVCTWPSCQTPWNFCKIKGDLF